MTLAETFTKQLNALLAEHDVLAGKAEHKDLSDQPKHIRQALITKAIAAGRSVFGSGDHTQFGLRAMG
jgi:hypothetical protein